MRHYLRQILNQEEDYVTFTKNYMGQITENTL